MRRFNGGCRSGEENRLFEFNMVRQLILGGDSEDEDIWQLSLALKFASPEARRATDAGGK